MDVFEIIRASNGSSSTDGLDYNGLIDHYKFSAGLTSASLIGSGLLYAIGNAFMETSVGPDYSWRYTYDSYRDNHDVVVNQSDYLFGKSSVAASIALFSVLIGSIGYSMYRYAQAERIGPEPVEKVTLTDKGTYVSLSTDSKLFIPDFSFLEMFPQGSDATNHHGDDLVVDPVNEAGNRQTFDPAELADRMHAEQLLKSDS